MTRSWNIYDIYGDDKLSFHLLEGRISEEREDERLEDCLPLHSRRPKATSSNLSLTSFTRSTCASTSPLFLILIAARAARANSYDRETDTPSSVVLAGEVVGRMVFEARTAARSTLDARRMARSRRVSSKASGGVSFFLVDADAAAGTLVLGSDMAAIGKQNANRADRYFAHRAARPALSILANCFQTDTR